MSIYPDKKDGKLTGRFRVEVQGRYQRYRARCDSIGEARLKDAEFRRLAAEGLPPPPASTRLGGRRSVPVADWPLAAPQTPVGASTVVSALPVPPPSKKLSTAIREAEGRIWQKPKTAAANETNLRIMHETMGDTDLNQIDTAWVLDLKEKLKDTRKGKTGEPLKDASINRFLATLSKFLTYTVDKGWRTVATLPKMEYGDEDEGRIRWFSAEEEATLMSLLTEECAKLVGVDIRTGLRRTEILTLELDQIGDGCVHVWKTKSGSPRTVPLAKGDEETLRWLLGEGGNHSRMPTDGELRGEWERARKAMGLESDPDFVFHACRHTYATRAVQKGVPIRILQKLMGHKTIAMTERYSHVHDEMLMGARDRMFATATAVND
jgi:integrase